MFKHVLGHAENPTYRTVIGYPSLIFWILKAQKLDMVNLTDFLGPPTIEICINHKLYEGHHLRDVHYGKKKAQSKGKLPKTLLNSNQVAAARDQPSTLMT